MRLSLAVALLTACASAPQSRRSTPPEAYAAYLDGRLALERGENLYAAEAFRQAAQAAPDEAEPRIAAADALLLAGRLPAARSLAKAITDDFPREARAFVLLGRVDHRLGDLVAAAAAFERAVSLDREDLRTYLYLASTYRHLGRPDDALAVYRRLVASIPDSAEGHYRLGESLAARRRLDESAAELARAVAIDPDHTDARIVWAEVARQQGNPTRAAEILRAAFQRSRENAYVGERLFRVLLETGRRDDALELVRSMDDVGRDPRIRLRLAHFLLGLQRPEEALAIIEAVRSAAPDVTGLPLIRARALARLNRTAEAIRTCLDVLPQTEGFADCRAFAAGLQGPVDGLVQLGEAIQLEATKPGRHRLLVAQAALYERQGKLAEARQVLDVAAREAPADEDIAYARARLEERCGDPDTAVAVMRRILAHDPANVLALNFIGFSYADRGVRLEDSERMLRRAVELSPDDGNVLDSYGWMLLQRGDLSGAVTALERADRLLPFQPEILYHLGELYLKQGDSSRARDAFLQALSLSPDVLVKRRLEERVRTLDTRTSR